MASSNPQNDLLARLKEMAERRRGPIVSSVPPAERIVLFVDMLGFAALTEAYPIDVGMLNAYERPSSASLEMIFGTPKNPLTEAFHGFHSALRWAIDMANMRRPVTAITFSDSAFVAFTHLIDAATLAVDFERSMLSQRIPVRIGIAFGSFAALRFRSDVTAEGGDHASDSSAPPLCAPTRRNGAGSKACGYFFTRLFILCSKSLFTIRQSRRSVGMPFDLSSVQYLSKPIPRPFAMNSIIGTRRQRRRRPPGGVCRKCGTKRRILRSSTTRRRRRPSTECELDWAKRRYRTSAVGLSRSASSRKSSPSKANSSTR